MRGQGAGDENGKVHPAGARPDQVSYVKRKHSIKESVVRWSVFKHIVGGICCNRTCAMWCIPHVIIYHTIIQYLLLLPFTVRTWSAVIADTVDWR